MGRDGNVLEDGGRRLEDGKTLHRAEGARKGKILMASGFRQSCRSLSGHEAPEYVDEAEAIGAHARDIPGPIWKALKLWRRLDC